MLGLPCQFPETPFIKATEPDTLFSQSRGQRRGSRHPGEILIPLMTVMPRNARWWRFSEDFHVCQVDFAVASLEVDASAVWMG